MAQPQAGATTTKDYLMRFPLSATTISWSLLLLALAVSYIALGLGVFGFLSARSVSAAAFGGALGATVAVAVYFLAARKELNRQSH